MGPGIRLDSMDVITDSVYIIYVITLRNCRERRQWMSVILANETVGVTVKNL